MHRKFDIRRYLTAFFVGVFAIIGSIVAIDAPARAASQGSTSTTDYTGVFNSANGQYYSGTNFDLDQSSGAFTAEAWVRDTSTTAGTRVIFGQGDSSSNRFQFGTTSVTGDSTRREVSWVYRGSVSTLYASGTGVFIPVDAWTHLAFVSTATTVKIYVNGQSAKEFSVADTTNILGTFYVGRSYYNNDSHWQGDIDELRVWAGDQSANIASRMHTYVPLSSTDLRAYFDFNEGSGTSIYNRVNDASLAASASSPTFRTIENVTKANGKTVVTFPRSYLTPVGGWTVPSGATLADALAIGGGGGGGSRHAGGGGAGEVGAYSGLSLTPAAVLQIKVGAGGAGFDNPLVNNTNSSGQSGQSSKLGLDEFLGGGGGQGGTGIVGAGGSGGGTAGTAAAGGAAVNGTGVTSSPALARYASAGGRGNAGSSVWFGGGGGGATSAGTAATTSAAGAGGKGFSSSITGTPKCYAAGGGGGATNSSIGAAGTCANGAATSATPGTFNTAATYASANSGSGGGAGGLNGSDDQPSGAGGSGIVVIAYAPVDDNYMNFNGSSQYGVASGAQVIPSTGPFTFEAWVNPAASAPVFAMIASQGTSSNLFYVKRSSAGKLIVNRGPASEIDCGAIPEGEWTHIAVSVNGANLKCFINGNATASNSSFSTNSIGAGFYVGQYAIAPSSTSEFWKGGIDQIKVWNTAITDSALIARSMHAYADQDSSGYISGSAASPTLTNLYPFNEATGTATVADMFGSATLSTTGSPTSTSIVSSTTTSGRTVYSFPRTFLNAFGGWFSPISSSVASVLVVAGGGGGGGHAWGGGGGAGAILSANANQALSTTTATKIIVGQGGSGGGNTNDDTNKGSNGQNSTFGTAVANGGGGGGGYGWSANARAIGSAGGSGGGHSEYGTALAGATSNQSAVTGFTASGNDGGALSYTTGAQAGSGGGGAGATGTSVAAFSVSGSGGAGLQSSITGTATYYAAGGAGGTTATTTASLGGSGIGGNGGSSSLAPTVGAPNTGSGGGGVGILGTAGAAGGSGIVIAAVVTTGDPTITSHPASVTKSSGQTATFSVTASSPDSGTLSYQWEVSANNGTNWLNVSGGTGATTSSYTTGALVSADLGKMYRVKVTNTLSGSTATATSNTATLTIGLDKVNVAFDELNFDYANISAVVGTTGKNQGDKILFLNVTTKGGVQVDALVTTETLSGAAITNYENGARAGGANSYFQTDVDFTASNGYAQFKFDFYKHGVAGSAGNPCTSANTTCSGATKVVIQNVNVSAIDIDYYQWNDFTAAESYTLAGNTKLKECAIPNTGTCTVRSAPTSYPADIRFQGSPDTARTNDPVDMAIVTYADIETFRIKFGRDRAGSPNYFGVAFKALDWGTAVPQTTGGSTTYTISYDVNGGTGAQTGTHVGAAGSSYTVLPVGTGAKAGYTFAGWATTSTSTTATYTASSKVTMPGSNTTLYAVWTPVKYVLTYDANSGTGAPGSGSYDTGTNNVTLSSTVPTRTGYVFGGWNTAANGGATNYASAATYSMPASNTKLYAKWTIANGTLAYNGNNGTTTETSVTAAGGSTTTIATGGNTNRTGYDFVGWNSKADGTGTSYAVGATFTLVATVTTTIYAQWTLSKYTLIFNVNGGVGTPQSQSYVQGATTTMPVINPTRAGYTFGGWNTSADGTGTNYNGSFLMPGNNLTLYAKWTPITYSVTYSNNAATFTGATGTVSDSSTYASASTVTVKVDAGLAKTNFIFIGWNSKADGTGTDYMPADTFAMPAANVTLYAQWLDASIEIAYNANGGTGAPANVSATLNSNFTISSTVPTRSGYTFGGWVIKDGNPDSNTHAASSVIIPNTNEILVAQWSAVNYTITYNSDGGSTTPTDAGNKNIDDTITVNSNEPTKTGYTFLGWKDADGNIYPAGGTFKMPPNNVVLTAQWQGNAYTLNYDANGGSAAPIAETRNYNAQANLSGSAPIRTGYTFQGWNTNVGGTSTAYNTSAPFTMPNSNTTLFAQWTANTYVLAYDTQGGSTAPSSSNKNYGASVTVSASTPTRSGYSFAGWNTAANGTGTTYVQSDSFTMPDANVTLYAQWTKTAFTLYYNTNGGQGVYSSQPVKYTESVTVDSTIPTKTGYTFSGWNTAANGSGFDYSPRGVFTLNVAANVTIYAKWTPVSYTVSYNANTGSGAPAGGSYTYGASVTTASGASPLALVGFRFIGWNDRADGSGTTYVDGGTFSMPAENVILYAQWIDSTYQIAYNANGGSGGPDGATAADGSTYTIDPIQPVRPGYTFGGWKLQDGTPTNATLITSGTKSFTVNGNELLVAQWTIKTINVTYDLNGGGGTAPSPQSGNYNTNVTLASSSGVNRSNFQFVGWSTTPDGSGPTYADGSSFKLPTDDVILYARWAPVYYIIEYNPAGGTGEPADQFATPTSTVSLATQEPTKAGYEFEKWTEVVQGTNFTPGGSLTMPSNNLMLVANYTVKAAGVPGSGSGGSNTGLVDPNGKPIVAKPKVLTLSVYFKGDSPVLTSNTKIALKKLAALAKSYGRANNITIYGRVKETNDKSYDMRLSKARASNVAAFLKKYGVIGIFQVYAKGISPENTYKSRRVDMKLWWAK